MADKHGNPQPAIIIPAEPDEMLAWRKANCRDTPRIFGAHVFGLHTTYGFPPDMTRQMARELQLDVEMDVYEALMREHEDKSRGGSRTAQALSAVSQDMPPDIYGFGSAFSSSGVPPPAARQNGALPATDDRPKWSGASCEGAVLGWIADKQYHSEDPVPEGEVGLLLDRTCFYAEQGGQVGDHGTARTPTGLFEVTQTVKLGNAVVHLGRVTEGRVEVGQTARLEVAAEREFTRKNHTTTHLLHWALRQVLGEHVEQRGSKVKPDEFTFDFSHTGPLTEAEKGEVERLVNEQIYQDLPVQWRELAIKEAQRLPGVRAFFGEKYGDVVVRVVEIGDGFSREFCGGTHLDHTGQAGFFKIVGEESVAKGIRRLTCVTARAAVAAVQKQDAILADLTGRFRCKPEELPARIDSLQEEIKKLQQQLKKGAASDLQGSADKLLAGAAEVQGVKIIVGELPAGPEEQMRQQVDRLRQKAGSAVVVIGWSQDSKVQLIAAVTDDLVKKGLHAGKLIGQVAKVVGGGGGGKPSMAQAGGKEPAKLAEALELAKNLASQHLLE